MSTINYKNYKISRDLAWKILLDTKSDRLPISVSKICRDLKVIVKLYEPNDSNSGYSILYPGEGAAIYVSSLEPRARQRFTAAHELGHILLGHVGQHKSVNREPAVNDNPIEQAANVFAARLLAPACVLRGCGVQSADEIAALCDISKTAAEFRWERMKILLSRDKFFLSPLETAVNERFEDYIKKHRLR